MTEWRSPGSKAPWSEARRLPGTKRVRGGRARKRAEKKPPSGEQARKRRQGRTAANIRQALRPCGQFESGQDR
jgi:hypothetical protein